MRKNLKEAHKKMGVIQKRIKEAALRKQPLKENLKKDEELFKKLIEENQYSLEQLRFRPKP